MPSLAQLSSRQREILDLANDRGFVSVEDLASMFTVTTQTVRRDLNELCDIGFLKRFHGGAGLPTSAENISYDNRTKMALDYKRRIASQVADNIPDGASVFIDVGTTTEEIAKMLAQKQRLRVITNSLNVAQILAHKSDFEVIMSCGVVRESDRAVLGEVAVNFFRQFRLDYGILGTSGIDDDGTLLDFDLRKVEVTKAIIERSRRRIVQSSTAMRWSARGIWSKSLACSLMSPCRRALPKLPVPMASMWLCVTDKDRSAF